MAAWVLVGTIGDVGAWAIQLTINPNQIGMDAGVVNRSDSQWNEKAVKSTMHPDCFIFPFACLF